MLIGIAGLAGLIKWYLSDTSLRLGEGIGRDAFVIVGNLLALAVAIIVGGIKQRNTGQRSNVMNIIVIVLGISLWLSAMQAALASA
ncbi:MAG: hypothetical protein DM484_03260 [Candidatus Methylumidiphilus alinenensis]|uniref:Uncharacterized protein n=1 Tax=Candidatus Methylumidiphilus alinenensis TaxID=2202197 RepID=A0A2W4RJN5_9GAMM|nr:MAG: hypothetical protein DM484_03260 [Candidatus Methylumidiphilus alinenensis]